MWNTSADGARPNLRTKETFSPFTNKGREQKAEGKLWQKTVPLTWAVNTEKHRGKFSHLQLGYDSYQLVEIPPVGTAYPSLEIKNLRSSQKKKKKRHIQLSKEMSDTAGQGGTSDTPAARLGESRGSGRCTLSSFCPPRETSAIFPAKLFQKPTPFSSADF